MKCFHASTTSEATGEPLCDREALVRVSESDGLLQQNLPLCSECAQAYARQAAENAVRWLTPPGKKEPITITLRPIADDGGPGA